MDDLRMVKELRSSTPAIPAAVEDSVRRRLQALTSADEPAPRSGARFGGRRVMSRVGLVSALAAVAAAGIIVAQRVGDPEPAVPPGPGSEAGASPESGSKPGVLPEVQLISAVEFGDRAAKAAERLPYKPPGPKQWVYTRSVTAGGFDMNTWWNGVDVAKRETVENWERVDRGASAYILGGKLRVMDRSASQPGVRVEGGGPLFHLGNYHTLPTNPDALLRHLYESRYPDQVGATGPQDVFETMSKILQDPSPPKLRAAIYRALPKISGVVLQRGVLDAAGRRGVAFAQVNDLGERVNIILDPATYRYLGIREEVARPRAVKLDDGSTITTKPGTVLSWYANVDQKIVDKPGQRS
jgi:hypothetical protein